MSNQKWADLPIRSKYQIDRAEASKYASLPVYKSPKQYDDYVSYRRVIFGCMWLYVDVPIGNMDVIPREATIETLLQIQDTTLALYDEEYMLVEIYDLV